MTEPEIAGLDRRVLAFKKRAGLTARDTRRIPRRQVVEASWYFASRRGIHEEKVSLGRRRPEEATLEADQQPFLIEGSPLDGYTNLFRQNGEEYRRVVLSAKDPTGTAAFRILGKGVRRIERQASMLHAACAYNVFDARRQRDGLESFIDEVPNKGMCKIEIQGLLGNEEGAIYFKDGQAIGAKLNSGIERTSGYKALFAVMLLNAYRPAQLRIKEAAENDEGLVNQGFNSIEGEQLKLLHKRALHEINTPENALGNMLFNISIEGKQTTTETESNNYAVYISGYRISGMLVFKDAKYQGGNIRVEEQRFESDEALSKSLELLRSRQDTCFEAKAFRQGEIGYTRQTSNKSTIATAAEHLASKYPN